MPLDELSKLVSQAASLVINNSSTSHRHTLIRRMAEFYSEPSLRQTAVRMARDLNRYQQVRWRQDRKKSESEIEYQKGGKSATMLQLMKVTDGKPPSEWRIQEVLSGRKCGR